VRGKYSSGGEPKPKVECRKDYRRLYGLSQVPQTASGFRLGKRNLFDIAHTPCVPSQRVCMDLELL